MGRQAWQGGKSYGLTRRVFLGGALAGGTATFLAACGAVATAPAGD